MEAHFGILRSQISRHSVKVKQEVEGRIKDTLKEVEKSLQSAWNSISGLQEDTKTHSDFKKTCQQSVDTHRQEINLLKNNSVKSTL